MLHLLALLVACDPPEADDTDVAADTDAADTDPAEPDSDTDAGVPDTDESDTDTDVPDTDTAVPDTDPDDTDTDTASDTDTDEEPDGCPEGSAFWTASDGTVTDVTASLAGTASSPAAYTLAGGQLRLCGGTFHAHLTVTAEAEVAGESADATWLSGGGAGRVVDATGQVLSLRDLTIAEGWTSGSGGCVAAAEVEVTDARITACEAVGSGGAVHADRVGLTGSTLDENRAGSGGAVASGASFTMTDSRLSGNAAEIGAAVLFERGSFRCVATTPGAAAIVENVAAESTNAAVFGYYDLATDEARSTDCDWGTAGADDNDPHDLYTYTWFGTMEYLTTYDYDGVTTF